MLFTKYGIIKIIGIHNMKEDKLLEYRIKRLERLIRNQHKVKNEAKTASVGRKMFAVNINADFRHGIYVITDDEQTLKTYMYELPRLREDGYSDRAAVARIFHDGNVTVVGKPCRIFDRPTVMSYGDYLDGDGYTDLPELQHLDWDDLVFVDKNEQVHELEFLKFDYKMYRSMNIRNMYD